MDTVGPLTGQATNTSLTTYADDLGRFMLFEDVPAYKLQHQKNDELLTKNLAPLGLAQNRGKKQIITCAHKPKLAQRITRALFRMTAEVAGAVPTRQGTYLGGQLSWGDDSHKEASERIKAMKKRLELYGEILAPRQYRPSL